MWMYEWNLYKVTIIHSATIDVIINLLLCKESVTVKRTSQSLVNSNYWWFLLLINLLKSLFHKLSENNEKCSSHFPIMQSDIYKVCLVAANILRIWNRLILYQFCLKNDFIFPSSQKCVLLIVTSLWHLTFNVQMMYVQSFLLEGCFHIHLLLCACLKAQFKTRTYKHDFSDEWEVNHGPICSLHKWDENLKLPAHIH